MAAVLHLTSGTVLIPSTLVSAKFTCEESVSSINNVHLLLNRPNWHCLTGMCCRRALLNLEVCPRPIRPQAG